MATLWHRKMGSILNVVYDQIMVTKEFYHNFFNYTVPMTNVKDVHIIDVADQTDEKFFYILNLNNIILEIQFQSFGGLPLSNRVFHLLKNNKNFNVIFLTADEADIETVVETLDLFIKNYNLNPKQFFIINLNEKLPDLKIESKSLINVHTTGKLKYIFSKEMSNFEPEFTVDKNHLFSCYNRNLKSHRFIILCYLKKHNLLDKTDWSWLRGDFMGKTMIDGGKLPTWFLGNVLSNEESKKITDEVEFFKNCKTKRSVYETDLMIDVPPFQFNWNVAYQNNTYKNSYINIVTESDYEQKNLVLISEKTLIPLYFNQIPIILANPHHIKKLKQYGDFDFFDDVVDHRYDEELDPEKRMIMVVGELKKLAENENKIIDFYKKNQTRFIENRNRIKKFIKNEIDIKYFNSLI